MSDWTLTKTRLFEGVWEGVLSGADSDTQVPKIKVTHLQESLEDVEVVAGENSKSWFVRVPIPVKLIADGVQTFLIQDDETGATLESFAILSGDALSYDIRAEVILLREELDMLNRAFRRHCVETT